MNWSPVDLMLFLSMVLTVLVFHLSGRDHAGKALALAALVLPHWCGLRCGFSRSVEWGILAGLYLTAVVSALWGRELGVPGTKMGRNALGPIPWFSGIRTSWRSGRNGIGLVIMVIALGVCGKWFTLLVWGASVRLLARFSLYDFLAEGFALFLGLALPRVAARWTGRWFRRSRHPVVWRLACLLPPLGGILLAISAGWFAPLLVRSDVLFRFALTLPMSGLWLLADRVVHPVAAWLREPDPIEAGSVRRYTGLRWKRTVPPLSLALTAVCLVLFLVQPFGVTPPAYPVGEAMWLSTETAPTADHTPERVLCLSANQHGLLVVRHAQVVWFPWAQVGCLEPMNRYGQASVAAKRPMVRDGETA